MPLTRSRLERRRILLLCRGTQFVLETLETYTLMDESQAKQIVEASHEAFLDWRLKPLEHRAKVVKAIGEAMNAHKEELTCRPDG